MKKVLIFIAILGLANIVSAAQSSDAAKQELKTEANRIVSALQLDKSKEKSVYNVLYHVNTRLEDLALGTPNYDKLVGYINEERTEMMKIILSVTTYKEYDKLCGAVENARIEKLKTINKEYAGSSKSRDVEASALMQRDRVLSETYK